MGLSNKLTINSDIDGEYTLLELLEMLGSPAKVKTALSDMESAFRKLGKRQKEVDSSQASYEAKILKERDEITASLKALDEKAAKILASENRLTKDREAKTATFKNREVEVSELEEAAKAKTAELAAREKEIARRESNLAGERKRMEEAQEAADKEITKDMKAAEKYRQQALKIRREADDKVEAMKKLVA
jgi:hypothetical protein